MSDINSLTTHQDGVNAGEAAVREYESQSHDLGTERRRAQDSSSQLTHQIKGLISTIVDAFLPSYNRASCVIADGEIGMIGFSGQFDRLEKIRAEKQGKLSKIEADPEFSGAESRILRLEADLVRLRTGRDEEAQTKSDLESDDDLMRRYTKKDLPSGGLMDIFLKLILIGFILGWLDNRKIAEICRMNGAGSLKTLYDRYDEASEKLQNLNAEIGRKAAVLSRVQGLTREHATITSSLEAFDAWALEELRKTMRAHLNAYVPESWKEVRGTIRQDMHITATTLMVLLTKVTYLGGLIEKLGAEARDRDERARKIGDAVQNWRRRPHKHLRGDKTKWLVTGPAHRRLRTDRNLGRYRGMHDVIDDYDDYDAMDSMLDTVTDILIWDTMMHSFTGDCPFNDSFVGEIIDVAICWRDENSELENGEDGSASAETLADEAFDSDDDEDDGFDYDGEDEGSDDDDYDDDGFDDRSNGFSDSTYGSGDSAYGSSGSDYGSSSSDYGSDDGGYGSDDGDYGFDD
jgi:hypothetical protein